MDFMVTAPDTMWFTNVLQIFDVVQREPSYNGSLLYCQSGEQMQQLGGTILGEPLPVLPK